MVKFFLPLLLAATAATAQPTDAYKNNTAPIGTFNTLLTGAQTDSLERGNQINLSGTARVAMGFVWILRPAANGVAMFDARIRFYANDGPGGAPGTIIWDSGPRRQLTDSGPDVSLAVPPPPITLPNTFTWTIQVTNRSGIQNPMGPAHYNPPTVGSAPFGYWERSAQGVWSYTGQNEPPFGASVVTFACYANCDASWNPPPILNVLDFGCFLNRFAAGDPFANCDASTQPPTLNVLDFSCFVNRFAAGCP